jgi:hypothetical protein
MPGDEWSHLLATDSLDLDWPGFYLQYKIVLSTDSH